MQNKRQVYLVSFLVNVTSQRTGLPDQARPRIGLVSAESEEEARQRIKPLAQAMGATFDLELIDLVDRLDEIPKSIRRYCQKNGFDLIVAEKPVAPAGSVDTSVRNCS